MENRIRDYYVEKSGSTLDIYLAKPDNITLTTVSGGTQLDTASRRKVVEAIRLIADETVGGCILCSTGAKGNVQSVLADTQMGFDFIVRFNLATLIAQATADGDTEEVTALGSIDHSDMFTIKMDWGEGIPAIDISSLAKQGSDPTVTLTGVDGKTDDIRRFFGLTDGYAPTMQAATPAEVIDECLQSLQDEFGNDLPSSFDWDDMQEVTVNNETYTATQENE